MRAMEARQFARRSGGIKTCRGRLTKKREKKHLLSCQENAERLRKKEIRLPFVVDHDQDIDHQEYQTANGDDADFFSLIHL